MPIAYVSWRCGSNASADRKTSARSRPGAPAPRRIESRRLQDRSRRSASTPTSVSGMAQSTAAAEPGPLLAAGIRWDAIVSLVLASAALMGSPGPATISVAAVASAYGVRRSLGYVLGLVAGTSVVLVCVATGVTAALLAVPALEVALIAGAAAYILWLAYRIATAPSLADQQLAAGAPSSAGAVLLAVANPKAWVAIA